MYTSLLMLTVALSARSTLLCSPCRGGSTTATMSSLSLRVCITSCMVSSARPSTKLALPMPLASAFRLAFSTARLHTSTP
uniref:Putative secreted protein n=1 Tax=Ixodes ricinus TaxID=34613 RepID=A0A147BRM5_IXORI